MHILATFFLALTVLPASAQIAPTGVKRQVSF
jgi:hypothetical protein